MDGGGGKTLELIAQENEVALRGGRMERYARSTLSAWGERYTARLAGSFPMDEQAWIRFVQVQVG